MKFELCDKVLIKKLNVIGTVIDVDEESADICLKVKNKPSDSCLLLLNSLILGLQGMEDGQYTDFIDIIFEEV